MKRNKIRYKSEPKVEKRLTLTGTSFLMYRDDTEALHAQAGDVLFYPQNDALNTTRQGEYASDGFAGYFKMDVSDGKTWCAVILPEIFTEHQHHFSKKEFPIDTFAVCEEIIASMAGRQLRRTYREHYELLEDEE
jgi:hypothetical protein